MATFRESVIEQVRNAFCTYLGAYEGFLNSLPSPPIIGGDAFQQIPLGVTRFTRRFLCDREPPAESNPPFSGGQCPVEYDVTLFKDAVLGDGSPKPGYPDTITVRGLGPVLGFSITQDPGFPEFIYVNFSDGNDYAGNLNLPDERFVNCAITNVVRVDGLPDNCGDPLPPIPSPPQPSEPIDLPIDYTDPDGDDFSLTLPIIFAPIRVNLSGELVVPFRLVIDPTYNVSFNGEVNINTGDIGINFKNVNLPPEGLPNQDDYDSPDDIPPYPPSVPNSIIPVPPAPDEDDTPEIIRACIVTVTAYYSNATRIFQDENPDIYAPNLGFINFGISINNAIAWTSDIPVKNFRNFIECSWEGGAIAVRGTPRPGVTWTITPVRLRVEKPIEFA